MRKSFFHLSLIRILTGLSIQAPSVMQLRLEASPSKYTEFKALLLPLSVLFAVPRLAHILAKKVKTLDAVEL